MKPEKQKDHNIPYMFVNIGHYGNTCLRLTLQNMHHKNAGDELQSNYDTPSSWMWDRCWSILLDLFSFHLKRGTK